METLQLRIEQEIATVALNRPDKRNALNTSLLRELLATFTELDKNPEVKVIVLQGNGKAFCAGADLEYLQQISEYGVMENLEDSSLLQRTFHAIYTCSKPTIAMVHGAAIAGGCGLATVCDFVVAAKHKALFGYSEVKIGFIPAVVSVYALRKIGDTQTRRLLLSAENIDAEEALRIGLVTHIADDEHLAQKVKALAESIRLNSGSSMALTKKMIENLHGMDLDAGLRYASSMNAITRMTEDCKRGIADFLAPKKE